MAKHTRSKTLNRRQVARRDREARAQRIIIWITAGILGAVLIILGYGLVTELLIKARKPVASVGEISITTRAYQNRLRYERLMLKSQLLQYQSYINQFDAGAEETQSFLQQLQLTAANLEKQLSPDFASMLGKQILDQMLEEELVRQETRERGIVIPSSEVDLQIETMMGYDREAAKEASATDPLTDTAAPMTEAEYKDFYENFEANILQPSKFSEAKFREMVEANLLREKLQTVLSEDVNTIADQVEITIFVIDSEEAGQALHDRIDENSDDVEAIVEELNMDANEQSSGYTLPWLPVGYLSNQLNTEIEKAAFNTPVGHATAPLLGPGDLYYVLYVNGHEEREMDENLITNTYQQKYQEWLAAQIEARSTLFDWEAAVITD